MEYVFIVLCDFLGHEGLALRKMGDSLMGSGE